MFNYINSIIDAVGSNNYLTTTVKVDYVPVIVNHEPKFDIEIAYQSALNSLKQYSDSNADFQKSQMLKEFKEVHKAMERKFYYAEIELKKQHNKIFAVVAGSVSGDAAFQGKINSNLAW